MLFPFRTSAIFRNRWVALLWAAGICFMASEIVDSVAGVTKAGGRGAESTPRGDPADPVAVALGNAPAGDHPARPIGPPMIEDIAK